MVSFSSSILISCLIVGSLSCHDFLSALIIDLLDFHDPLAVPVVLPIAVLLKEILHPTIHLTLHVVILGLNETDVGFVEVGACRQHFFTILQKLCLASIVLGQILILSSKGLHLRLSTFKKPCEEHLLQFLES